MQLLIAVMPASSFPPQSHAHHRGAAGGRQHPQPSLHHGAQPQRRWSEKAPWAIHALVDGCKVPSRAPCQLLCPQPASCPPAPAHSYLSSLQEGQAILLHAPATPGVLGALRDYVRAAFGTRVLMTSLMGVLLHQPPTVMLLQQAALMWLSRADYCR